MTITTKYDIGDEVWFMDANAPTKSKICHIIFKYGMDYIKNSEWEGNFLEIEYGLKSKDKKFESELFPTKEELLKSL